MAGEKKEKMENRDKGETKKLQRARFTSKPLRPDSVKMKSKTGKEETAYERLTRIAEEEEENKYRQRKNIKRTQPAPRSTGPGNRGGAMSISKIRQNENSMITAVVISVIVLILVIWFSSSLFLTNMAKRHTGIASGSPNKATSSEQEEKSAKKETGESEASSETEQSQAAQESEKPAPLTEGDAEFRVPESWVGKKFAIKDDANVRSGPGTTSGVIGSVDPGESIEVHKAESLDDATWVYGIITKKDGAKIEGWVYAYAISPAVR